MLLLRFVEWFSKRMLKQKTLYVKVRMLMKVFAVAIDIVVLVLKIALVSSP